MKGFFADMAERMKNRPPTMGDRYLDVARRYAFHHDAYNLLTGCGQHERAAEYADGYRRHNWALAQAKRCHWMYGV